MSWPEKVSKTREELQRKIMRQWQFEVLPAGEQPAFKSTLPIIATSDILSQRELEITNVKDATTLLGQIHSGTWTAEEVIIGFSKRAVVAHQLVNCLMDVDFEAAINRARELDSYFKEFGKPVGPLHGLPISIKDLTAVCGLRYTMGYVSWADNIADKDAVVVETLKEAGAVIYVKTTMPQSGMALETVSHLFGRTLNPFDTRLTPGGSSGGEAALIACRGSILGMGTDSGGSIRLPAAFNGLYCIKPTSSRISYKGNMNNSPGGFGPRSSIGPMAHSLRDLRMVLKVLVDGQHWLKDAAVVEKPWAIQECDVALKEKLCIGLAEWDGAIMPHPPIRRALRIAEEKLRQAGHEGMTTIHYCLIEIIPYRHPYGDALRARLYYSKGTRFIQSELDQTGEPPIEAVKDKTNRQEAATAEVIQAHREWLAYKDAYLGWWMQTASQTLCNRPIDALLIPAAGSASFPHDHIPAWRYQGIFNMLDYPAITLPVTTVQKRVDRIDTSYQPISSEDKRNQDMYDPEMFDGMPVGLQLVGRPFTEENLFRVAEIVDDAVCRP